MLYIQLLMTMVISCAMLWQPLVEYFIFDVVWCLVCSRNMSLQAPSLRRAVKIEGGSAAAWGLRSKVLGFGQSEGLRRFSGCCLDGCSSSSSIKGGGIKAHGVEKGVVSKW
jgi:hypothetical protein